MTSLYLVAFFALVLLCKKTRRFGICFLPWMIYAVVYDSMRFYPNYMVNAVDTGGLYDLEKRLFGITLSSPEEMDAIAHACHGTAEAIWESGLAIPGEWFALHHNAFADILSGICYLCWIPVPAFFAIWLFFSGRREWASRFSWAFLIVNLLGFAGYYIHPASPPWYVINYGFDVVPGTPGNVAGLGRFDQLFDVEIFHGMYSANSNVFAAMPSMHAAYLLVATVYSLMSRQRWWLSAFFALLCGGIWFAAVYSQHHYILDVAAGATTVCVGIALYEMGRRVVEKKCRRLK